MSDTPSTNSTRMYCDGELSPRETARVETQLAADPALAERVEHERRLRAHVATVLRQGSDAPANLAGRIRDTLSREAEPGRPVGGPPARTTAHRAWWRAPLRANAFAVAACFVLVAGAVLVGIFGRSIDSWPRQPLDVAQAAGAAVAREHVASAMDPAGLMERIQYQAREQAGTALGGQIGGKIPDLTSVGYQFIGGNTCQVPHCDEGCHLFYRRTEGRPGLVSLHIVPDLHQLSLRGNPSLEDLPIPTDLFPENQECRKDVLVWSHGQRYYLLVVCLPQDTKAVARQMQAVLLAEETGGLQRR